MRDEKKEGDAKADHLMNEAAAPKPKAAAAKRTVRRAGEAKASAGGRAGGPKKRVHGVEAEINRLQASTDLCIKRLAFTRLVRGVSQSIKPGIRFEGAGIRALQEASEAFLVGMMEDSYYVTRIA